jgi:hypothetical protein
MLYLQEPHYSNCLYRWIKKYKMNENRVSFLDLSAKQWSGMEDFTNRAPIQTMSGPLPPDGFALDISVAPPLLRRSVGEEMLLRVDLVNHGSTVLCGVGSDQGTPGHDAILLAYRWIKDGTPLSGLDSPTALPKPVEPGESAKCMMRINVPRQEGHYQLEIEAVQEGVAWFKDRGSPGISLPAEIFETGYFLKQSHLESFAGIPGSVTVDFKRPLRPEMFEQISGLFGAEQWGAWSDGKQVVLEFSSPLPEKFRLHLVASAFGPNAGREVAVTVGPLVQTFVLDAEPQEILIDFDNPQRANRLIFDVPEPVSPWVLSGSEDKRKLGIGFITLHIVPLD